MCVDCIVCVRVLVHVWTVCMCVSVCGLSIAQVHVCAYVDPASLCQCVGVCANCGLSLCVHVWTVYRLCKCVGVCGLHYNPCPASICKLSTEC